MSMHHLYLMTLSLLLLCGCQRRDLTYDYEEGVPFRVELNWSNLKTGEEQPQYVKALFFPAGGGKAVERYIKTEGQEVQVPAGAYNIIIYTWRTNAVAQTVQFRGNSYDTFEAYTEEKDLRLPLQRSGNSIPVVPQPDALYAWNSTNDPVEISYTKGLTTKSQSVSKSKSASPHTLIAVMQSMVREYQFEINVRNAEELNSLYAVLTEVYGSQPLGNGTKSDQRYGLLAQEVVPVGESGEITTYRCSVKAFGFHDTDKSFIINITNTSGGGQQETIDITGAIDNQDNGTTSPGEPIVVAPKEKPIEVERSEVGGGFVPPTLGDWEQKNEDIDM